MFEKKIYLFQRKKNSNFKRLGALIVNVCLVEKKINLLLLQKVFFFISTEQMKALKCHVNW